MSPVPDREHQKPAGYLYYQLFESVEPTGLGEVYFAPVDVRFSERNQVQPDLLVILHERREIYRGHIVHGAPDIVVENLSPSNRTVDLVEKARLYAEHAVPEYSILDTIGHTFQMFRLESGRHLPIAPNVGRLRSTVIPDFDVDLTELFARLKSR